MGFGSIGGGGGAGGGIEEAPISGILYGRRNAVWWPTEAPLVTLTPPVGAVPWDDVQTAIEGLEGHIVTADEVMLNPEIPPWLNAQEALEGIATGYVKKTGDVMSGRLWIGMENPPTQFEEAFSAENTVSRSRILLQVGTEGSQIALDGTGNSSRAIRLAYDGLERWAWWGVQDAIHLRSFNPEQDCLVFDRITGLGRVAGDPVDPLGIATRQYVDAHDFVPPDIVGGSGIRIIRDPTPPGIIEIDSELYDWQQTVNANNNQLNNVGRIGINTPSEAEIGIRVVGGEALRASLDPGGLPYTFLRLMINTTNWGGLVVWGPTAPVQLANTVGISTGTLPITFTPNNVEVMRVLANRVGIMTTTPQFTLDVNGEIRSTTGFTFPDDTRQTTAALPDAPLDPPEVYGRFQRAWVPVLPLAGGTLEGPLTLAANPLADMQAATKQYVDQLATGALHYIGNINAATGQCTYTQASGFPDGDLVPSQVALGAFVVCVVAGTIPSGPAVGIAMNVGDWLLSNFYVWSYVPVGTPSVVASNVTLAPDAFGASNVQLALNNAETAVNARLPLAGGTMTGPLMLFGNPGFPLEAAPRQYVDVRGLPPGGFNGQVLTKMGGADFGAQWTTAPAEAPADNLMYGRRNFGWARAVAVAGDTMTGALNAPSFVCNTDNAGFNTFGGGRFYKASGADGGMMIRKSGLAQPQIEEENGTNRRVILDANNGVTLGTAQTITGAKQFNTGINFGVAAVATATDLTRHIRLWQGTGNTGFGFSITNGRLNYVVTSDLNTHAFLGPSSDWVLITSAGLTTVPDGTGLITNGGGRFYKAVGSGIIIRQVGTAQPQIEDNNGTNRRNILDTVNGVTLTTAQTISGAKTFTASPVIEGSLNCIVNRTANNQRPGLLWQESGVHRWQWRPTGDAAMALGLTRYNDAGTAQTPDVISFDRTTGLGTVAGNPTAPLGIATRQFVEGRSSVVPWTAGQNYVVGQGVLYDNRIFRVLVAITNAPATPNFTTISPTGYGQTDYWSGNADITNWVAGNWVLIATMPAYGTYRVEISDLHASNDTALMVDIVTGYNTATAVLAGQTHQGAGSWSELRLSQASNGSAVRLELKIATRNGTPNFKVFVTGETRGTNINETTIPKPLAAAIVDIGGTTRARIEDLLFASFATSGDIATSYGKTIRFSYLNTSDVNDGKIGARLFNRGLNIIGVATETGDNMRYIGLWGTVDMRQTGSDFILARDPTAPMQAATKQYVDSRVGGGTGGASTASAAGCIDLSARFARVYSEGSDAGVGNNPPTLRTNSNGIHVSNANYVSPVFLPPVNYLGDGEPFFFQRDSDFGLTINTDRTSLTAPVVVQYPNTAVFIRNGFDNVWDYVGQVRTRLLQTPLKFNALANSYTLPANRGANNSWLASNGTGGTFWTGPLLAEGDIEALRADIRALQLEVERLRARVGQGGSN